MHPSLQAALGDRNWTGTALGQSSITFQQFRRDHEEEQSSFTLRNESNAWEWAYLSHDYLHALNCEFGQNQLFFSPDMAWKEAVVGAAP